MLVSRWYGHRQLLCWVNATRFPMGLRAERLRGSLSTLARNRRRRPRQSLHSNLVLNTGSAPKVQWSAWSIGPSRPPEPWSAPALPIDARNASCRAETDFALLSAV